MNVYASVLVTVGIFTGQVGFAQNEVRTVQTSTNPRPVEVKQINNTPVIYIHKTEQPANSQSPPGTTPSKKTQQRCIRKCEHQSTGDDSKKKELKEPVKSNQ